MSDKRPEQTPVLVCAANWIGDSIMTMPALQCFRRQHPDFFIAVLAKSSVAPLWRMHSAPNEVIELPPGLPATLRTGRALASRRFESAWILPNSFRSAFIPWLAGIPNRIGCRGHCRAFLLTRPVSLPAEFRARHQAWEYMHLLCAPLPPDATMEMEPPQLTIPPEARAAAERLANTGNRPYVVLLPGAARGPAKRWPADHFAALGKKLAADGAFPVILSGSPIEQPLCEHIARQIGAGARSLAGRTSFAEWAALLAGAQLVICNDSGGMHLAAAVGTRVLALYGITDPAKTGPLAPPQRSRIVQNSPVRSRDIPRSSAEAAKWLASIAPEQVYEEALKMLG